MRNILRYIVCACLALALGSCIKDELTDNTFCRDGMLNLNIGINGTRANNPNNGVGQGDNDNGNATLTDGRLPLNENRIDNYEVFLFVSGATGEAVWSTYFSDVNATDSATNNAISVPAGALNTLFADGATSCNIYVVANVGESLATMLAADNKALTLANLKAHIVTADFTTPKEYEAEDPDPYNSAPIQPNFVMDSEGTDTVTKSGNNLSGEVFVTRAASKISFMAYIGDSMTIDGNTWTPDFENVRVAFNNVVEKGAIDNGSDTGADFTMPQVDSLYRDLSGVQLYYGSETTTTTPEFEGSVEGVSKWQKLQVLVPFYTYSNIWDADEKDTNPSIVLTVPWFIGTDNDRTNYTTYNYTIPLTSADGDLKLVRNKHYNIALRVGVLGDLEELAESEFSYEVLDWVGNDITVDLADPTYLVVEKHSYEMFNEEYLLIPYSTSDECIITGLNITQDDLLNGGTKSDHGDSCTAELVVIDDKTYIRVYNDLDNNLYSDGFDFTKYNISLTISHKNADGTASTKYTEKVNITQYPAIYGYGDVNSDYSDGDEQNDNYGYVWTNGYRYNQCGNSNTKTITINNQSISNFGGSKGVSGDDDLNAISMYVISVSSVEGTNYVIGDPRTRTPENSWKWGTDDDDNDYTTQWYTANNLKGESQAGPQYYYPTDADLTGESNNPTYHMIAPKFRVCSAYGAISYSQGLRNSYGNVKGRCASYQEDGFPAGRWRLPTKAEFELINVLSNKGLLPTLYVAEMNYWSAHGYGRYSGGTSLSLTHNDPYSYNSVSVRCVYDDWYWGSEPVADKSTFTWGDEPRE